jgi:hypothetical protein
MLQLSVLLVSSEKIYTYGNLLKSGRKETDTPVYTIFTSHHNKGAVLKFMLSAVSNSNNLICYFSSGSVLSLEDCLCKWPGSVVQVLD